MLNLPFQSHLFESYSTDHCLVHLVNMENANDVCHMSSKLQISKMNHSHIENL